jgi:hypothetical protein
VLRNISRGWEFDQIQVDFPGVLLKERKEVSKTASGVNSPLQKGSKAT